MILRHPRPKHRFSARRQLWRFNLRRAMFILPNLFTLSSIFCGFYAIVLASQTPDPTQLYQATLAIFFGVFFDMADGRVARLTRTQSEFGVQIDSLADVITFGVAPAVIAHQWGLHQLGLVGIVVAFIYVACGAIRLARFNVLAANANPGSSKYFIGLPIPLAAGVLTSSIMFHQITFARPPVRLTYMLILLFALAYLMISSVRYRTFKDAKITAKTLSALFFALLLFAFLASYFKPALALLVFFGGYSILGLAEEILFFGRRRQEKLHLQT